VPGSHEFVRAGEVLDEDGLCMFYCVRCGLEVRQRDPMNPSLRHSGECPGETTSRLTLFNEGSDDDGR